MPTTTSWVKRPTTTKGLDPLAVQAPCINLYGHLLPGITNVTDRARYYSFYPWIIWAFAQLPGEKSHADLIRWVRRADCLFTLIGIRHRLKSNDNDVLKHDARLTGSQTLRPVVTELGSDDSLDLSEYAVLDDGHPHRYFKNRLGGLGQYYIGTLDGVGLMGRSGRNIGYTPDHGKALAEAFDSAVDRSSLVAAVQADKVTVDQLDELSAFCPCQIVSSTLEHEILLDLFFDRKGEHGDAGLQRKYSLGLLLDLVSSLEEGTTDTEVSFDHHVFRACAYTGFLPGGQAWDLPPKLKSTREGWAVYQRNELMSLAVQGVFWVALKSLEEQLPEVHTVEDFVQWFTKTEWVSDAISGFRADKIDEALVAKRGEIPDLAAWQSDEHEISMARRVLELCRSSRTQEVRAEVLELSAHILLSLMARDDADRGAYDPMSFPDDYFSLYPINLKSLRDKAAEVWRGMDLSNWLGSLAGYWGVEAHLRVALRKLRHDGKDTFHVRPTDHGLRVVYLPDPGYTTPRFGTTLQILQDLGTVERPRDREWIRLTGLGDDLRRFAIE